MSVYLLDAAEAFIVSSVVAHVRDPDLGKPVDRAAFMPPALVDDSQTRQDTVINGHRDTQLTGRTR